MLAEAQLHLRRLGEAEATLRRVHRARARRRRELPRPRARAGAGRQDRRRHRGARASWPRSSPSARASSTSAWPSTRCKSTRTTTRSSTPRAPSSSTPTTPRATARLGEMYRSKQDAEHAIAEFRAAITKNDRLFVVYFELADLLLSKGQADEADRLFRRVVRGAPDEELVARAARLSMQINLGRGHARVARAGPPAHGHRRAAEAHLPAAARRDLRQPHVRARAARPPRRRPTTPAAARAALARIGSRAVKPLLDALADPDVEPAAHRHRRARRTCRTRTRRCRSSRTRPARPSVALRARAMVACGALADRALVPKLEGAAVPEGGRRRRGGPGRRRRRGGGVGPGAHERPARPLPVLRRVAREGTPPMRALAVLGLGRGARSRVHRRRDGDRVVGRLGQRRARRGGVRARASWARRRRCRRCSSSPRRATPCRGSMALVALARMAAAAGKEPAVAATRPCRRWPTPCSRATTIARARAAPTAAWRAAAIAGLAPLAGVGDRARAGARRRARCCPCPRAALDVDVMLDALVPARGARGGARGGARRSSRSRSSAPRWPRCERRADARARCSTRSAPATGELLPFVPRGATGPAADAARAIAQGARAEPRPAGAPPQSRRSARRPWCSWRTRRSDEAAAGRGGRARGSRTRRCSAWRSRPWPRRGPTAPRCPRARAPSRRSASSWRRTRAGRCACSPRRPWDAWATRAAGPTRRAPADRRGHEGHLRAGAPGRPRGARRRSTAPRPAALAARMADGDPEPRVRDAARAIAAGQPPRVGVDWRP